jgi:hypothetical protein
LSLVSDRVSNGSDAGVDASFQDATPDGAAVLFSSAEQITNGDSDSHEDIFRRSGGATVLTSDPGTGLDPLVDNGDARLSDDGSRVYFETAAALVAADGDASQDVYGFHEGTVRLVSDRVQAGPDEQTGVLIAGLTPADGVLMRTSEPLVAGDGDAARDIYATVDGPPRIVSDRVVPGADQGVDVIGFTRGSVGYVITNEPLASADEDATDDVYELTSSGPALVGDRENGAPDANLPVALRAATPAGEIAIVETSEALSAGDTNGITDAYAAVRVPDPAPAPPGSPGGQPGGGGGGGAGPGSPPPVVDSLAPALRRVAFAPRRLTLGKTATIKFNSSEAGKGTLVFERVTCKKKSRRARRCTKRFSRVGRPLAVEIKAGANSVRFKPGRGFKAGAHRLRLNATDAAGNKARELRANFTLVKAKKKRR